MPNGLIIGLFAAILGALAVIVWWEFSRARNAFSFAAKVAKPYIESEPVSRPVRKEVKRGLDMWK